MRFRGRIFSVLVALFFVAACRGFPKEIEVHGPVSFNGKYVGSAQVGDKGKIIIRYYEPPRPVAPIPDAGEAVEP